MGPSGSGKSTLMNLHRLPRHADLRHVRAQRHQRQRDGRQPAGRDPQPGDRLRLPDLQPAAALQRPAQRRTAADLRRRGTPSERREMALEALAKVGLADRVHHKPNETVRRPAPARGRRPRAGEPARRSSWPTNRPATSTRRPATEIMALFEDLSRAAATPSSWSPTRRTSPATPAASSASATG